MPGYGLRGPTEGTGLLPWRWAHERLSASHDYWLASIRPVWAFALDEDDFTGSPTRWSFVGDAGT